MDPLRPTKVVFVVPTTDLAASTRFYAEGLGLELIEEWDDMGRGALLRASSASEIELLELDDVPDVPEPRTGIGIEVRSQEVDTIYRRLEQAGFRLKAAPRVRAWGMRGFGAVDPSGVPVNVYAPVGDASPSSSP